LIDLGEWATEAYAIPDKDSLQDLDEDLESEKLKGSIYFE
jgi:endogenous inhibitor of DNA gyrase (YacG/DUF329 family)